MNQTRRDRPRSLSGTTTVITTAHGNLYLTVSVDDVGAPFEVFGQIGKAGTFERGVTEMACRLVSLHLRRGTPVSRDRRATRGHPRDAALAERTARRLEWMGVRHRRRHRARPAALRSRQAQRRNRTRRMILAPPFPTGGMR